MRIEHTIDLNRPPADVFAFVTDPAKLPEWQPSTVEVRRHGDGPVTVGERFAEIHAFLGRRLESCSKSSSTIRPTRSPCTSSAGRYRWTAAGPSSRTTAARASASSARASSTVRSGSPLHSSRSLDRRFRSYHALLKNLLES